jgi:hypothetical protein
MPAQRMYYKQLKDARIRNIVLCLVLLALTAAFFGVLLASLQSGGKITILQEIVFGVLTVGSLALFIKTPFGHALDKPDPGHVRTYFHIGPWKFNIRTMPAEHVRLEQDNDRYYCVTFESNNGQKFVIQRWQTLDKANEMLAIFDQWLHSRASDKQ